MTTRTPAQNRRAFLRTISMGAIGLVVTDSAQAARSPESPASIRTRKLAPGERYGVGIVGCGARSEAHIEAIKAEPRLEIRAMCDLLPEALANRKRLYGEANLATYTNYGEMVCDPQLDAVVIATPNDTHRDITIAALDAGKHVLCEKPMALQVADCDAMLAAQMRAERVLILGNQRRHAPSRKEFVRRIHAGAVGDVLYATVSDFRRDWRRMYASEEEERRLNWRYSDKRSGGITFEMSIHGIDYCNWILRSEPVEVVAMGGFHNPMLRPRDSTDHVGCCVRFANGAMLNYAASLYSSGGYGPDVFSGTSGAASIVGDKMQIVRRDYGQIGGLHLPAGTEVIDLPRGNNGTAELHRHFAAAMAGEEDPTPDGWEGRRGVQIARAVETALAERRLVRITELLS